MADEEREAAILARCEAATKGPWAWASTGEKCYGANVGAGCFAEADNDCETPLTGDLSGREDDYFVEQGVAEMEHQNCNSDAAFIAHAREDVPWLLAQLTTLRARAERAERALAGLQRSLDEALNQGDGSYRP